MKQPVNKSFISPEDLFLEELRRELPETASQKKERVKHEGIAKKRDKDARPARA